MERKIVITLFYVARLFIALVGSYICWIWTSDVDYSILAGVGYFLILTLLNLEVQDDELSITIKLYTGTVIALALSYAFIL